ncbi:MAG: hypothetical protein OWQ54_01985 [Sulfolobaceae archaeon]|nr:hypothetical protein [Sulfolobaceae archaeon]
MLLISTLDGVYLYNGNLRQLCCKNIEVRDSVIFNDKLITCGKFGLRVEDKTIVDKDCWGIELYENDVLAFLEGPILYSLNRGILLDLSELALEKDWYFPHGAPHFTSISKFKDKIIISVEEGNLLVGDSVSTVKPIDYFEDVHNLYVYGKYLLIATANGIEATQDLKYFMKVAYGYSHGITQCGSTLYAQIMDRKPILSSRNGTFWDSLPIELEPPSFGTTNIACYDGKLYYSAENLYIIEGKEAKKLYEIPYTLKIRNV